ncbi:hypothetical protein [Roseomonas sp. BN140053]|uniref:hypothetical protein n=1 Tax=Roseomonas sp. BN140053 TaxID=3391898 RepID=UPI0039EA2C20
MAEELVQAVRAMAALEEGSEPPVDPGRLSGRSAPPAKGVDVRLRARLHLVRANNALAADLASRINRGEFHLRGRPIQSEAADGSVVIPSELTDNLTIDPEANSVSTADQIYSDVEAVLGPAPSWASGEDAPDTLPLWDALVGWCSPQLLFEIRRHECYFSRDQLRAADHPTLGAAGDGRAQLGPTEYQRMRTALGSFWWDLRRDLKRRIERGEVYVQGVQTRPDLRTEPEPIPSVWATDFDFDFEAGSLTVARYRFIAVTCSLKPPTQRALAPPIAEYRVGGPGRLAVLHPEDVAALEDDTILALLEEHARRVVDSPDAKLFPPGKISLLPLIRRKMLARAAAGETQPSLASEMTWLAEWIALKAPSHQVPTAATLENVLRNDYRALSARSNATIP